MNVIFYITSVIAIVATLLVVTRTNAVHALLYLIVSLLSISVIFFILGAPFIAALEVIIYAGVIMILFVFVVMMLNQSKEAMKQEKEWFKIKNWIGPSILSLILLIELVFVFIKLDAPAGKTGIVDSHEISASLFGPYVLGVEMVAMLLMTATVGAFHIAREKKNEYHRYLIKEE
ncbi:MAG: NADH-quinone oxidoreductase subunit J [Ginsengibacter sp.]